MFTYEEMEEYLSGKNKKEEEKRKYSFWEDEEDEEKEEEERDEEAEAMLTRDEQVFLELQERKEQLHQIRERRLRRQCMILGAAAILLGALAAPSVYYDTRTEQASYTDSKTAGYGGTDEKTDDAAAGMYDAGEKAQEDGQRIMTWEDYNTDLLILVNKDNPLPEDFAVELHELQNGSCEVAELMYDALAEMLTDGADEGLSFVVASGYRDTQLQQQLLEEDIAASMEREGLTYLEAYEKETRETMPPGYSEHETGLAVDIVSVYYQMLDERQEMTQENRWLREHCSEYGFILRYPKGKEDVTGIDYESWHFRYVGEDAAREIMRRGITLEEYLSEQ